MDKYALQDIRRRFPSIINSRPEIKEIRNCALNIDFQILFFSLKQIALHLQKKTIPLNIDIKIKPVTLSEKQNE